MQPPNKRIQSDVTFGHAADARRFVSLTRLENGDNYAGVIRSERFVSLRHN